MFLNFCTDFWLILIIDCLFLNENVQSIIFWVDLYYVLHKITLEIKKHQEQIQKYQIRKINWIYY